jgi:hypothetical protein
MMKYNITKKIYTLGFLLVVFSSCDKCDEPKEIYQAINEQDIKDFPYTGLETLAFYREPQKDTLYFAGQGEYPYFAYVSGVGGGDCKPDSYKKQGREFRYYGTNNMEKIVIQQQVEEINPDGISTYTYFNINYFVFGKYQRTVDDGKESITIDTVVYNNLALLEIDPINYKMYQSFKDKIVFIKLPNGQSWYKIKQ